MLPLLLPLQDLMERDGSWPLPCKQYKLTFQAFRNEPHIYGWHGPTVAIPANGKVGKMRRMPYATIVP